jgi:hypothetical protein
MNAHKLGLEAVFQRIAVAGGSGRADVRGVGMQLDVVCVCAVVYVGA